MKTVVKGNFIHTPTSSKLEILRDRYMIIDNGVIVNNYPLLPDEYNGLEVIDYKEKFIIPSFVDLHLHSVQYANIGLGLDLPLLPWLKTYTYPEEEKFNNLEYAKKVFSFFIRDLYNYGTLRSCIFSSLHKEATLLLMDMLDNSGMAAYVGKTNMDRNSIETLFETSEDSYADTKEIIEKFHKINNRIKPIITPRFIPSCSNELLEELGKLASETSIGVQSHLNENLNEIEWVKELVPDSSNYLDAYKIRGLVRDSKTIMAHSIFSTDDELKVMKDQNVFIAHCPSSNMNLTSGIMQTKRVMDMGINVGLGSDIAAGDSLSMNRVMVDAIKASKLLSIYTEDSSHILDIADVFYLATKGGGKFFDNTGSFENGNHFDALIIDDSSYNIRENPSLNERLEMFIYRGDDRNIIERYFNGKILDKPSFIK